MNRPEHTKQKKSSQTPGFYVALALCVLAIAAAAWSTYDSIAQFAHVPPQSTASVQSRTAVSSYRTPSSAVYSYAPSSLPASSAPLESTPAVSAATEPQSSVQSAQYTDAELCEPPFLRPVEGEILHTYTTNLQYSQTMRDWRVHLGTDYAAPTGESVYAVADGEVLAVETDLYYGNTVTVRHGAYTLRYCGLGENIPVAVGQTVNTGDSLGVITAVPCEAAEEPHLHLQAVTNGETLDPELLF